MQAAYETENNDRFKRMGIEGVADKEQFGGESLLPDGLRAADVDPLLQVPV